MSCERSIIDQYNTINGLYILGQTIGTGHFAVVKLARHIFTQKEVAVKVIDKAKLDEVSRTHLFQEVQCMKLVQHPNVVRLYEVIDTPNKLYLILEFADGGDMYDYLIRHTNGLNEPLARKYFRQICRALKYCHEMYVCHRDLKPENLVFFEKQGVVKLTDFGFSNLFSPGKKLLTSCGSLAYSAPEILLGDPYDAPAVDMWSLGVILYMLVTGRVPFQEANDSETVMMILDCSYKVPPHISPECQNLIYHMIVRDPEKRATLDEVMSDVWYRQYDHDCDNDDDDDQHNIDRLKLIPKEDRESILQQMVNGNIADRETILQSLNENQYNHITATYYLLAENLVHDKYQNENRNVKRQKFSTQRTDDQFKDQIGVFLSPTINSAKESTPSIQSTPRHSLDGSNEQIFLAENEEERSSSQQRGINPSVPTPVTQAMKIILEEDENPESTPTENVGEAIQQLVNLSKLDKIIENDDSDEQSAVNPSNVVENLATTSNVLRSKDLRSVVETKRRNISRSCSSSDSEDNGSSSDMNRITNPKHIRAQSSHQEAESTNNNRGRSMSNIEHTSPESITTQQQTSGVNYSESVKRKNVSRTNSLVSATRSTVSHPGDDINADFTNSSPYINDRMHALSNEHRLANTSLMSISSRASLRHSTPRESTVFTKADAPNFIRLLQQKHHQEVEEAVKILSENEHLQTPVIVEEDMTSSLISQMNKNGDSTVAINTNDDETKPNVIMPVVEPLNRVNGHVLSSSQSIASKLRSSLIKRQRKSGAVNTINTNGKQKRVTNKQQVCCIIS